MPTIKIFQTAQEWIAALSNRIAELIVHCQETRPTIRLALSGGSTPRPVYEALSQRADIDWSKVEIYLVDERFVPATDPRSNAKLVRDTLVSKVQAEFFPIDTTKSIVSSVKNYEQLLRSNEKPLFHLVILGVGEDGHIASLFPGSPALSVESNMVAHTKTKVHDVADRITLTFPAILSSEEILVLVRGQNKKPVIDELISGKKPATEFPAAKIRDNKNAEIYFSEQ